MEARQQGDLIVQQTTPVKRKKWMLVVAIFLYVFSALAIFGIFGFQSGFKNVTEENTTEYTGTISQISVLGGLKIYTHEQDFPLAFVIPDVVIDEIKLNSLAVNDEITFRIRDFGANTTINGIRVHVVAVSFDGYDIITLESFNKYLEETRKMALVGFGILGSILFVGGTLLIFGYYGKFSRKNRKNN